MEENNPLYPLGVFVRSYYKILFYTSLSLIIILTFHSWYTKNSYKIINYQIQDSGSIALILNYKDRTTLDELGFGENKLFSIIKDLSSSEYLHKAALNETELSESEIYQNLELISKSYDMTIDRKNKDANLKRYIVSFNTYLNNLQAEEYVKKLIILSHEKLERNIITNISLEIEARKEKLKYETKITNEKIDRKNSILQIMQEDAFNKSNNRIQRTIAVLENNLAIAIASGFEEIQSYHVYNNLYSSESEKIDSLNNQMDYNNLLMQQDDSQIEKPDTVVTLIDELYEHQKEKYMNEFNAISSYSSTLPLYLLGSKILEKEIEILKMRDYVSVNEETIDLNTINTLRDFGESENFITELRGQLEDLYNLEKAIKKNGLFNKNENIYLLNYYPSSFTYSLVLPDKKYFIIFSIFVGIILTILHLIITAAFNFRKK